MQEIEYIPLKTPAGAIVGHARVRGGTAVLTLRTPVRGRALILTQTGAAEGAIGARIPLAGPIAAVALHEDGALTCCGFARASAMDLPALRRRVLALAPEKKKPKPPQAAPAKAPQKQPQPVPPQAPQTLRASDSFKSLPVDVPDASGRTISPSEAAQAVSDEIALLELLKRFPDAPPEKPEPPRENPAHSVPEPPKTPEPDGAAREQWDREPDDASERVLKARAERLYQKITALYEPAPAPPPMPESVPEPAPRREPVPEPAREQGGGARGGWAREAEELLTKTGDSSRPGDALRQAPPAEPDMAARPGDAGVPVQHPFPHIFPGAVFTRDDAGVLTGVWRQGKSEAGVSAVPGPYSPQPPAHLPGYTRYIRARSGGFWVKVTQPDY